MNIRKILLVDDEPVNRYVLAKLLEQKGYTPIEAANGKEALDILHADKELSIMILDLNMPEMDGYAVLAHLHTNSLLTARNVRILIASAGMRDNFYRNCLQRGVDTTSVSGYLEKPFDIDFFYEELSKLTELNATASTE